MNMSQEPEADFYGPCCLFGRDTDCIKHAPLACFYYATLDRTSELISIRASPG